MFPAHRESFTAALTDGGEHWDDINTRWMGALVLVDRRRALDDPAGHRAADRRGRVGLASGRAWSSASASSRPAGLARRPRAACR